MANGLLIDARTFLGNVWKLSAPYWRSEEKWRAWGLLGAIVALSLSLVYMLVLLNDWNRQFYNALEQKDERDFFALLGYFCFLAGDLHRGVGLRNLPRADAPDALADLAHPAVPRRLARQAGVLPS